MNPRWLLGRTIIAVDMRPFDSAANGAGKGPIAHDPEIALDNGARLRFQAEETDLGTYGVQIVYIPAPRRKR